MYTYLFAGQKYEDKPLSDDARRDMVQKTAVKPADRFQRILSGINGVFNHQKDENLRSIGMHIEPKFIQLKGYYITIIIIKFTLLIIYLTKRILKNFFL